MKMLPTFLFLSFLANSLAIGIVPINDTRCFRSFCDPTTQYCDSAIETCASCANDCAPERIRNDRAMVSSCRTKCAGWYAHVGALERARNQTARSFNFRLSCLNRRCEILML